MALEQSDVCVKCHQSKDATFCVRCHGVEMPHPAYWYSNHGDIARANPSACVKCHPTGDAFCNECHHAGFSPTPQWATSQHGQVVTQQGAAACFVCHARASARACHPGRTFHDGDRIVASWRLDARMEESAGLRRTILRF